VEYKEYVEVVNKLKSDKPQTPEDKLHWACLELTAEAGEIVSLLAKAKRKEEPIPKDKLYDECSDVMWGLTAILEELDADIYDLMQYNVDKLNERQRQGIKHNQKS